MNLEVVKEIIGGLVAMARVDPEAAICLMDWARVALGRESEREKARRERRKPVLEPIELRRPSLSDLGVNVVGCSACAFTRTGKPCPGCGNIAAGMKGKRGRKARGKKAVRK